mmetsp:Transcript_66735/g.158293  ORF Transcript_66735/g.158293 Transcript_66735/m.158293 type:complete len:578 (+) Transcript_66735:86-1819(+)
MSRGATVDVSVRVRPDPGGSRDSGAVSVGSTGGLSVAGHASSWHYAHVTVTGINQGVAYESLAVPLLAKLDKGFSCTLLAYGQTGSGKTHTMFGPPGCLTEAALASAQGGGVPEEWGLLPRMLLQLLSVQEKNESLHASAVEVYGSTVFDLLNNKQVLSIGAAKKDVVVVQSRPGGGAVVEVGGSGRLLPGPDINGAHKSGCTCFLCFAAKRKPKEGGGAGRTQSLPGESGRAAGGGAAGHAERQRAPQGVAAGRGAAPGWAKVAGSKEDKDASFATVGETLWGIESASDVAKLTRMVEACRSARSHAINDRSSRSHCLVRIHRKRRTPNGIQTAQLLLADLAGSERMVKSGMTEGFGKAEATGINASLTVLGRVVEALSKNQAHKPYRDSTLTMLLRDSLEGQAAMSVVVCVSAESQHADETVSSLRYGSRLATVHNAPTVVALKDAAQEAAKNAHAFAAVRAELADMEQRGFAGHFAAGGVPSERKSLLDNFAKLEAAQREVQRLKCRLLETKGRKEDSSHLQEALAAKTFEMHNFEGIVMRQKSIRGLWIEEKPSFAAKKAELRELEAMHELSK